MISGGIGVLNPGGVWANVGTITNREINAKEIMCFFFILFLRFGMVLGRTKAIGGNFSSGNQENSNPLTRSLAAGIALLTAED
jgi:hypothetical protein